MTSTVSVEAYGHDVEVTIVDEDQDFQGRVEFVQAGSKRQFHVWKNHYVIVREMHTSEVPDADV